MKHKTLYAFLIFLRRECPYGDIVLHCKPRPIYPTYQCTVSDTQEPRHQRLLLWWRHQMEIFSASLAFCEGNSLVTDTFSSRRQVTQSFNFFFDLRLNQQLSEKWRRRWFETPLRSLWHHCNLLTNWVVAKIVYWLYTHRTICINMNSRGASFKYGLGYVLWCLINIILTLVHSTVWCHR